MLHTGIKNYTKKNKNGLHILLFISCMCTVLSGCAKNTSGNEVDLETASQYNTDSANTNTHQDFSLPEPEIIFEDADITLPAGLAGDEVSDELITNVDEDTANITYSLSGNERSDIIDQLSGEITESISAILGDKDHYPNITSITPNDDYTEFTITLADGNINVYESMLVMSFYIVGDKYQIYNGASAEEAVTIVRYVDSATGAVINETDSTSMKNTN